MHPDSLYGLKQAPQQWYKKFDDFIQSVGFSKSDEDHCLFTKTAQDGVGVVVVRAAKAQGLRIKGVV